MHRITVIGRLGQDPELRYTPTGNSVTSFSLASNNGYGDKKTTEWFRVSVFGKLAETCNQYLTKGKRVYLEGSFTTRMYKTQAGETRFSVDVIANQVQFLDYAEAEHPHGEANTVDDLPF